MQLTPMWPPSLGIEVGITFSQVWKVVGSWLSRDRDHHIVPAIVGTDPGLVGGNKADLHRENAIRKRGEHKAALLLEDVARTDGWQKIFQLMKIWFEDVRIDAVAAVDAFA